MLCLILLNWLLLRLSCSFTSEKDLVVRSWLSSAFYTSYAESVSVDQQILACRVWLWVMLISKLETGLLRLRRSLVAMFKLMLWASNPISEIHEQVLNLARKHLCSPTWQESRSSNLRRVTYGYTSKYYHVLSSIINKNSPLEEDTMEFSESTPASKPSRQWTIKTLKRSIPQE